MRRPLTRTTAAVASLVAVLALSACSGSDDSSDGSNSSDSETTAGSPTESDATSPSDDRSSTEEPSGDTVTGTGYSISVPDGWEDVTDLAKQTNSQADVAVAEPQESGKFRMNFNVVTPNALPPGVSEQDLVDQAAKELKSVTKAKVTPIDAPVDFDGAKALGQTSTTQAQGYSVTITQFVLLHEDDQIFATTLTYEDSREDEAMDKLAQIADSWTWNVS